MAGKSVLLVWVTLICGRVLVHGKPQVYQHSRTSSEPQERSSVDAPAFPTEVGTTKGFEVSHGYSFNTAATTDGEPYSSGWAFLGGRAGPGPTFLKDTTGFLGSDLWSGQKIDLIDTGLSLVAAAVAAGTIYYISGPLLSLVGLGAAKKPIKDLGDSKNSTSKGSKDKDAPAAESEKTTKSRRRRAAHTVNQADADLTRLASIVLNAIASGECLQKTICQIGTQVGESPKGRLAFSLIDTLLPTSVHGNQYFITMKKSLKGDQLCERFNCKLSF